MKDSVIFLEEEKRKQFNNGTPDERFRQWKNNNKTAFYLNIVGRKAVLHKADCWHLGDGKGMNSAANPKVCADNPQDLANWANNESLNFKRCSDCKI